MTKDSHPPHQSTVAAAMELAAAYVAREDTVRHWQTERREMRVDHADPAATTAILEAENRLTAAAAAYREAVRAG